MQGALDELDERGVSYEFEVRSAHRDARRRRPVRADGAVTRPARADLRRGALGCAAGCGPRAHTDLPVIGVPLRSSLSALDGVDALLAITQMPPGVPVAAVGVDNARNAAALVVRILGVT